MLDDNFLLSKSQPESNVYDVLFFARRDIEVAIIPSYIKIISQNAFSICKGLKSIEFEPNSSLEIIENYAFYFLYGLKNIIFPDSVKEIWSSVFTGIFSLESIQFLSKNIKINGYCFQNLSALSIVDFPNALSITIGSNPISEDGKMKFLIRKEAKLLGNGIEAIKDHINYVTNDKANTSIINNDILKQQKEI